MIYRAQQGRWLLWAVHKQVTNGLYASSLLKDAQSLMEWWELNDFDPRTVVAGPLEYILSQVHPNPLNQKSPLTGLAISTNIEKQRVCKNTLKWTCLVGPISLKFGGSVTKNPSYDNHGFSGKPTNKWYPKLIGGTPIFHWTMIEQPFPMSRVWIIRLKQPLEIGCLEGCHCLKLSLPTSSRWPTKAGWFTASIGASCQDRAPVSMT